MRHRRLPCDIIVNEFYCYVDGPAMQRSVHCIRVQHFEADGGFFFVSLCTNQSMWNEQTLTWVKNWKLYILVCWSVIISDERCGWWREIAFGVVKDCGNIDRTWHRHYHLNHRMGLFLLSHSETRGLNH